MSSLPDLAAFLRDVREDAAKFGHSRVLLNGSLNKMINLLRGPSSSSSSESDRAAKEQMHEHIHFLLPSAFASCKSRPSVYQVSATVTPIYVLVSGRTWRVVTVVLEGVWVFAFVCSHAYMRAYMCMDI